MSKLYIQTNNQVLKEYYKSWNTHHEGDSGVDLPFTREFYTYSGNTILESLGIQVMATDEGGTPMTTLLYPRSSIYKTPFLQANSVGVIDAGYRGIVHAPIYHRMTSNFFGTCFGVLVGLYAIFNWWYLFLPCIVILAYFNQNFVHTLVKQDRRVFFSYLYELGLVYKCTRDKPLFQLCAPDMRPLTVVVVDELPESSRGASGFGSTNHK